MLNRIICTVLALVFIVTSLVSCANEKHSLAPYGIKPYQIQKISTENTFPKYKLGSMEKIYGLAGQNVSGKDFSKLSLQFMSHIAFDADTKWPSSGKLPKNFSPRKWIQAGKDPGLQISELHKKGYTGKGISVAIIDKPIIQTHFELNGHIEYIPVEESNTVHFHGMSCASILAGRTTGVAPETKLYYFSVPDDRKNFLNYTYAIHKLLKINKTLSKKDKIRILSISDGINEGDEYWEEWNEALKQAESDGIIVLYSNSVGSSGFLWGGCPPFKDRNDPSNYTIADVLKNYEGAKSMVILPADFRTTATNQGDHQYTYWGDGGFSWAIPYLAGLCALGLQIDPNLKYDDMINALKSTKTKTIDGYSVINPPAYVKAIENYNKKNR